MMTRRDMYEVNKKHILSFMSKKDLVANIDNMRWVNDQHGLGRYNNSHGDDPGNYVVKEIVEGGSFLIYYNDVVAYLRDDLGLDYGDDVDRAWEVYVSMIGDDMRKLYLEICKKERRR